MNSKLDTATKKCTMCGEEKPIDEFRTQKQKGKTYTRPYCRVCEAIEVRRQYLLSILTPTEEQLVELNNIQELYRLRVASGLNTFGQRKTQNAGYLQYLVNVQLEKLRGADQPVTATESVN